MNVGFIGLGMMGTPMAARLLHGGHSVAVYNRTRTKAEPLIADGARWCITPSDVARQSDVVFTMVSTPEALRDITLGTEGILSGFHQAKIHVDTSTVSPMLTEELEATYQMHGCAFLHAPVLGSIPQATDGTLLLFVGGNNEAYERVHSLLQLLGKRIWRFEQAAQASHMKLLCNSFIAGIITVLAQALVYAKQTQVDPRILLDILEHSQLNSPMIQTKGHSLMAGNFSARFFLEHMLKDIRLLLDSAEHYKISLPLHETIHTLFREAAELGYGSADYSAVIKSLEHRQNRSTA